jgi:nucleotide-binding universal stress UspA family protein
MIAWNGSLEAARAVTSALSVLHQASRVTVVTAPWPGNGSLEGDSIVDGSELVEALAWHGIQARSGTLRPAATELDVGPALLRAAGDSEASMLVMGAFTRSRIRGFLLGGVTRYVLRNATIPTMMTH